ncbi:hypothetical protein CGERO_06335 [Corynebacterium gerontici]|uniref:DUF3000 domain-containing protein n=1 Tax=Corynebacterium gerontici TaxID=2079234 RepID=A0A3G6J0S8_9CORY|nr:DUF3000 domain-containing protein [Corynebacterium gerontici]AZA11567.1 hypothetical protein CGERO_06335 [Corynebacterium gerontici]
MNDSQATTSSEAQPEAFARAVESMHTAKLRPEISLSTVRPPQRLAPFSHAVGLEVLRSEDDHTSGDAFGRLIVLHDPKSDDAWAGDMRMVAYIQADMDDTLAGDPLLPSVAWQWLNEGLAEGHAEFTHLGGTVTSTASERFGDIGGPNRAFQLEMRASWTATSENLSPHVEAFSRVLAMFAGMPPEGVSALPGR